MTFGATLAPCVLHLRAFTLALCLIDGAAFGERSA